MHGRCGIGSARGPLRRPPTQSLAARVEWFVKWMAKFHAGYDFTPFMVIPMSFEQKELVAEINAVLDSNESANEMLRTMDITRYERNQAIRHAGLQKWQVAV